MSERDDVGGKSGRQPAEGVRIIKAEEAQAALEAGEAAGRRPDDQLRFGDVPPTPSGPRPAHRFPLPDSVNPAEAVDLPPLATPRRPEPPERRPPPPPPAPSGSDWRAVQGDLESDPYGEPAEPSPGPRPGSYQSPPAPEPPPAPSYQSGAGYQAGDESSGDATVSMAAPPPPPEPPRPRHRPEDRPLAAPAAQAAPAASPEAAGEPRTSWSSPPAAQDKQEKEPSTAMESPWRSQPAASFGGGDDRTTEMSVPEEGLTVSEAPHEMPHWTDPPTGEVPRLRFDDDAEDDDDLEAWKALGSRGVRWRDEDDWNDADELSDLASDVEPLGVLDQSRTEHSDLYSFDEDFERVSAARTGSTPAVDLTDDEADFDDDYRPAPRRPARSARLNRRSSGRRPAAPPLEEEMEAATAGATRRAAGATRPRHGPSSAPGRPSRSARPPAEGPGGRGGSDLTSRVAIGAGLVALLIIAYAVGAKALLALALIVIVAAAAEAYGMVRSAGFRPATLLGLVATAGCVLAAYWKGSSAIGVVTVFLFAGAMLWYVLGIVEARPLANVAVTVMVFVWVAVLGSYGAVMLAQPSGQGEFLGAIVVAVAADVCAFGVGRWIGSRPLAPQISPHKTVEGFIGGLVGALIAGAIIGKELSPWGGMKHGLVLGLLVGLIAPIGDLFESMIKRDLGIKDSGTILAGHGGLLDRFDGILLALPTAYFVITFFQL